MESNIKINDILLDISYGIFTILFLLTFLQNDMKGMVFSGAYIIWYKIDRIWKK